MGGAHIVLEEDVALRLLQVILDPLCPPDRIAAFADYVRHDLPDLEGWCKAVRAGVPNLAPCQISVVADSQSLEAALPTADVAVVEALPITASVLEKAPCLKLVQKFGTVLSNIDRDACVARGVKIGTLRRRTNVSVAEHSFALLLMLAKRMDHISGLVTPERFEAVGAPLRPYDRRHTPNSNWGRIPGLLLLDGAVLGLLGLGEIGREVARMARGFSMEVVYSQRRRIDEGTEAELGVTYLPMPELLARSDLISVHLPMNEQTLGFLGEGTFGRMKLGSGLVNTARAEIVDRAALIGALTSGKLAAAAFDVLYDEPVQEGDPLLALPNFIATPHLAGGNRMNGLNDMREMITGMSALLG